MPKFQQQLLQMRQDVTFTCCWLWGHTGNPRAGGQSAAGGTGHLGSSARQHIQAQTCPDSLRWPTARSAWQPALMTPSSAGTPETNQTFPANAKRSHDSFSSYFSEHRKNKEHYNTRRVAIVLTSFILTLNAPYHILCWPLRISATGLRSRPLWWLGTPFAHHLQHLISRLHTGKCSCGECFWYQSLTLVPLFWCH